MEVLTTIPLLGTQTLKDWHSSQTAHLPFQLCWSFLCLLAIAGVTQIVPLDSPVYHYMTLLYTPDPKVYSVMSFSFFQ